MTEKKPSVKRTARVADVVGEKQQRDARAAKVELKRKRDAIAKLHRAATFAVDNFLISNADHLAYTTPAQRSSVTVEAALAYLIANDLIVVRPAKMWPEYLPVVIPEELAPDAVAVGVRGRAILGVTR